MADGIVCQQIPRRQLSHGVATARLEPLTAAIRAERPYRARPITPEGDRCSIWEDGNCYIADDAESYTFLPGHQDRNTPTAAS